MNPTGCGHKLSIANSNSAQILIQERENILAEWVKQVKENVKTAKSLVDPIIIDTIPLFIERLAESLCAVCNRHTATEANDTAHEHGSERARVTRYGPEQVIQEYILLRATVRATIQRLGKLTIEEDNVLQKSFDQGIQESMISYFLVHNRIREQFVAALTHDLRNPINAAKLATDLIFESASDAPTPELMNDIKDLSSRSLKSLRRADRMIQEMLDASLVQIGESLTLNVSEGDIDHVVQAAVSERSAKETARLKVYSRSIVGHWDLDAFQRSLENLINNAFKYGAPDKPVTIHVDEAHGRVMVSVHNFGNPIPIENQEALFQVFRRAEAAKTGGVKGWGIGLALARSTAEKLGGSLALESSFDRGTTFTIDVPSDARPFNS